MFRSTLRVSTKKSRKGGEVAAQKSRDLAGLGANALHDVDDEERPVRKPSRRGDLLPATNSNKAAARKPKKACPRSEKGISPPMENRKRVY